MKSKDREKSENTEPNIIIRVRDVHLYRPEFWGKSGLKILYHDMCSKDQAPGFGRVVITSLRIDSECQHNHYPLLYSRQPGNVT